MTKIVATSDTHGYLPEIPPCDLLLLGGDICPVWNHDLPYQHEWLDHDFRDWLNNVPAKEIVGIAGNHDLIFEQLPDLIPKNLRWHYLQDNMMELFGLSIYGTPWQLTFFDWAFNRDEPELSDIFADIPECNVLVTHSPPHGYGDWSNQAQEHFGSTMLLHKIKIFQPKLHVFGHFHSGAGQYKIGNTISVNASFVNEQYQPQNLPWEFEL